MKTENINFVYFSATNTTRRVVRHIAMSSVDVASRFALLIPGISKDLFIKWPGRCLLKHFPRAKYRKFMYNIN